MDSAFVDPDSDYLPVRRLAHLERVGALTGALREVAERADRIISATSDGRVTIAELLAMEAEPSFSLLLPDEQAALGERHSNTNGDGRYLRHELETHDGTPLLRSMQSALFVGEVVRVDAVWDTIPHAASGTIDSAAEDALLPETSLLTPGEYDLGQGHVLSLYPGGAVRVRNDEDSQWMNQVRTTLLRAHFAHATGTGVFFSPRPNGMNEVTWRSTDHPHSHFHGRVELTPQQRIR